MSLHVPGHELLERLRHNPEQRRSVWRARLGGELCTTRVLHVGVDPELEGVVRRAALEGRARLSGLHRDLAAVLEGYLALHLVREVVGLPEVLAAGLATDAEDPGEGFPFVSTRWVEGLPLDQARLGPVEAERALVSLLDLLGGLVEREVVYGDLKPSNFVLGADGRARLIDPDTLRRVPDPPGWLVVADRTPGWAPPELLSERPRLYPSSDLYSFGLLACQLLAGARPNQDPRALDRLPTHWRRVARACLEPDPDARPRPGDALAALAYADRPLRGWREGAIEATTRVPEPEQTRRVPEPTELVTETPSAVQPADEQPRRSRWKWALAAVVVLGLLGVAGAGVRALMKMRQADQAAAEIWVEIRRFKTERPSNTEATLDAIVAAAETAVGIWPTPRVLGLQALVTVWDQRWHYVASQKGWDAAEFDTTLARVDEALAADRTVEALAARGVLLSGACRKMPASELAPRLRRCNEARSVLEEARDHLGQAEPWFGVELAWNLVMALGAQAQLEGGSRAAALRTRGLEVCGEVRDQLGFAPVNNWYLASDCLELAGLVEDYQQYLVWADWLLDEQPARAKYEAKLTEARVRRQITQAVDPLCDRLSVRKDGLPDLRASTCAGDRQDLCRAVALAANGCAMPTWRACLTPEAGLPWDKADAALASPLHLPCPVELDHDDLNPSLFQRSWWGGWEVFGNLMSGYGD